MIQVPKLSAPLTKLVRTGEGCVLFAFNAVAVLGVIVNDVSPGTAIKYAGIFNTVAFASRQVLKAVAVAKPTLGGAPITPNILRQVSKFEPAAIGAVSDVLAEIKAAEAAAASIQAEPGAPAETLTSGLAPTLNQNASALTTPAATSSGGSATVVPS